MKSFILIAVLAALTVCNDAASVPNESVVYQEDGSVYRDDIDIYQRGAARLGENLFDEQTYNIPGIPNTVQRKDVSYRGNSTTRITAVRISGHPYLPANSHVGALGTTHLTIRLTSAIGEGILTTIQFWGRYTDWS